MGESEQDVSCTVLHAILACMENEYTIRQAAVLLGIKPNSVRIAVIRGTISTTRRNDMHFISPGELARYDKARKQGHRGGPGKSFAQPDHPYFGRSGSKGWPKGKPRKAQVNLPQDQ